MKRIFLYCIYFIGVFLFFYIGYKETLGTLEQNQLFRFSADYFLSFSSKPYPILLYIQAFFTQFYYYPALGAGVICLICWFFFVSIRFIVQRNLPAFYTASLWAFALIAAYLPLFAYTNLMWLLVGVFISAGACLWSAFRRSSLRYGLMALVLLLLTAILQETVLLALIFYVVLELSSSKSWIKTGVALGVGITTILSAYFLIPFSGYIYRFYFTACHLEQFHTGYLFDYPLSIQLDIPFSIRCYLAVFCGLLCFFPLFNFVRIPKRNFFLWLFPIIGIGSLFPAWALRDARLEVLYQAEKYAYRGQWNKVDKICTHYYDHTIPFQESFFAELMADYTKLSLVANKSLCDKLFLYPKPYFPLLYPEAITYRPATHIFFPFYAYCGFYADALHYGYDLITTGNVNARILKQLILVNFIVGDYAPNYKFVALLEQSLFYRSLAKTYRSWLEHPAVLDTMPYFQSKRTFLKGDNYSLNSYFPDLAFRTHQLHCPLNAYAYDYNLALMLLEKRHDLVYKALPQLQLFHYPYLPRHIEEAILVYKNYLVPGGKHTRLEILNQYFFGYRLHIETVNRYEAFIKAYQIYLYGGISFAQLEQDFGNTYWFHFLFNTISLINTTSVPKGKEVN
ncbi:MAG: DUF6057 family protein [Bacteroidales bacterium]